MMKICSFVCFDVKESYLLLYILYNDLCILYYGDKLL